MSRSGLIIDGVAFDGTDLYVYSEEVYLRKAQLCSLGYSVTGTTPAGTWTLQAEAINNRGEKADQTDRTATYDTGWVTMTSAHGWDGFPGGAVTASGDEDTITIADSGHRKFRLKFERTGGSGVLDVSVEVKADI